MIKNNANNNGNGDGRLKALQDAIARIEKNYGKGAIMRLGEMGSRMAVEVIPSGSLSLDLALGIGGIPRGRTTEIFGPESSGKTTLAYHVAAEAQKQGGTVLYIDAEHAMDLQYAEKCGVKVTDLLISQPDWGEQALEIAEAVVRSGAVDLVVIDSVAALVPKAEIEGHMGDPQVGLQARLMSQALRKLCSVISNHRTALIFVNQLREKVGVTFGNPEITPGGRALKFYATVRIDVRMKNVIKEGESPIGHVVHARVVKNKVAPPFRWAKFDIMFGQGISREGELIDLGTELGILNKKGTWYEWNGQVLGQGREAARRFLKDHPEIAREIENCIRSSARVSAGLVPEILKCVEHEILAPGREGDGHRDDAQQAGPELFRVETWQLRN